MSTVFTILIIFMSIFVLFLIWSFIKSKKNVGKFIPFDKMDIDIADKIKDKSGLLYFHSPRCSNCKIQSPIIEELSKKNENIIPIDASVSLKTARALNVMGTPSLVIFGGNKIKGYFVGVKSESFITQKLQNS